MRFSAIKKPLALLFILAIVGAISLMAVNGVSGQIQDQGAGYSGGYSVPGVPGFSLGPGTNTVAMGVSIASQDDNRIYFQVNSFAVMDQQSQSFTVYDLKNAIPGIMDTKSNMVQIDIGKLQSSIQSTSQASMTDLYSVLRPSVNTLMVIAEVSQQGRQDSRATFQVQSLKVIMPDGQANEFDLSQPMSVVVDSSAMRIFTVGFDQMYSLINTHVTNIQNNYYTQINYNIVTGPVVVVSPPVYYPVLTPITFPRAWPVYYQMPVQVPIPVITVRPHPPSITPSMKPSMKPTMSPTGLPTVSPTMKPSIKPTISPTTKPSMGPSVKPSVSPTGKPVVSPTMKPSIKPSFGPTKIVTSTAKPSFGPTKIVTSTAIPSFGPTKIVTATTKPTIGGGGKVPTAYKPVTSYKPTLGGGGKVPTAYKPITTYTPTLGGGGKVPTAYKPITTYKPNLGSGGKVPTAYKPITTKTP